MDKPAIVADLKRVAELHGGRLTREQFKAAGGRIKAAVRLFHSWNGALAAASLPINHTQVFNKGQFLVMVMGDTHFPFDEAFVIAEFLDAVERKQPTHVVQIGDLYDLYSYSKFPRSHNLYTPDRELELGRDAAERFWSEVRRRAPGAKCFQLWGNHDDRAVKRILERSPEHHAFVEKGMRDLMTFDGVTTMFDSRDELVICDTLYIHGYLLQLGAHARANQCSTVCGHLHRGYVLPIKLGNSLIFEANAGWAGNRHAMPMSYAAQRRLSNTTTGYLEVDNEGAKFIAVNAEDRDREGADKKSRHNNQGGSMGSPVRGEGAEGPQR